MEHLNKKANFSIFLAGYVAMLGLGIISSFLTNYSKNLGATGFWLGAIFSGFVLSRSVSNYFISNLSNRWSKKIFITTGLLVFSIASLLYTLPINKYELTLIRLFHGLGSGMILPGIYSYAEKITWRKQKNISISTFNFLYYLSLASGPILGAVLFTFININFVFYFLSVIGFIALVFSALFIPEYKNISVDEPVRLSFRKLIRHNVVKAVLLAAFIRAIRSSILMSFVTIYLFIIDKGNIIHTGIIISSGLLVTAVCQFFFSNLSAKTGYYKNMVQIFAGSIIGSIGLLLIPFCNGFIEMLFVSLLIGLGAAISIPAVSNISDTIAIKTDKWYWMRLLNRINSFGFIAGPLLAGIALELMSIYMVFFLLAAISVAGTCIFAIMILWRKKPI